MACVTVTRQTFLEDRQGKTFADVANDSDIAFDEILEFFSSEDRQRRMQEAEIHHDRAPLAGVVRELEAHPKISQFLSTIHPRRTKRLRQAIGVVVRMIMERLGWRKTGRKGSLGVRAPAAARTPAHNTGGLAFWFLRAERYELKDGMPYRSVQQRQATLSADQPEPALVRSVPSEAAEATRQRNQAVAAEQNSASEPAARPVPAADTP